MVVNPTSYCHFNAAVPILRLYLDEAADHRAHLRLSLPSVRSLIGAVRLESDHGWERHIEVLVFLYWPAHAASYTVVSQTFDIPKTSVHDIVHRVSRAVLGILRKVICFPTGDDLEAVGVGSAQLARSPAFSRAVGAIDGCHIRIKPPANNSHCYYNRKLFHSIQLQAITDHRGKFLHIFVGYPGSVHDARVLRNSPVYTGSLYPHPQARFNSKHSGAWNIIERAFGMMKTRWRSVFFKALEISPAFKIEREAEPADVDDSDVNDGASTQKRLRHCSIGEEGCAALISALRSNAHLRELDLRGNLPGDSGKKLRSALLEDPHSFDSGNFTSSKQVNQNNTS
ncbi:hypothetical protein H4Q32_024121 [Labeo rohita]|uniref:DDE Tnp4 domain-containing protein n=1 Tax=Labeo rohita TaxID=84645 RepID=A0ABQ8L3T6_LABRO|nr:hypothetical protein H4Q32_024121 [Labeo rohita]